MMGCLTLATIIMFVLMRLNMDLTRRDAMILLVVYLGFVIWMTLEAFGVTAVLGMRPVASSS
jgi:cation:H+ antiporter